MTSLKSYFTLIKWLMKNWSFSLYLYTRTLSTSISTSTSTSTSKHIHTLSLCVCLSTQCAKDCGPYNHACEYGRKLMCKQTVFMQLKPYFNVRALLNKLYGEEQSQPIKCANKILVLIFLTIKATIVDTHNIHSISVWPISIPINFFVVKYNLSDCIILILQKNKTFSLRKKVSVITESNKVDFQRKTKN